MQLEPIAIIGIGCRFPGAKNPQAFWELIRDGRDGVREVPKSRWDINSYYDCDPSKPGKTNTRWGGFLEDIDYFDPQFFSIAPKEAVTMDPQQRLLLEVAWETLEDAGQIPETLRGSKTGVFIGIGTHDYSIMMWQQPVSEPYATTGTGNCIAANRISYIFDFKGPSLAVDTACSSSLVAVHLACQSIWTGESAIALAGGVNMLLLPTIMVGFSKGGFMSSEGRCKSFDAGADGYVRGEGAGLVLLKPLAQAEADGDDVYGVILSSAVNQDGSSQGMAAPNPKAQEAVLREAYERGGLDPAQVSYIEAHGTGTKVGDPIEMNALGSVFSQNRQEENNCLVGSVKTNIGHTETAAGIAGIIKVALALKHRQIPPSLHFENPNPAIAFDKLKLQVVTELTPWVSEQPLIAGVNSFGFGGTNAHIVMGDVEERGTRNALKDTASHKERGNKEKIRISSLQLHLLTLSAKSKSALQDLAQSYQEFMQQQDFDLPDICLASQRKRSHFNHRVTCLSNSTAQLAKQLTAFITGKEIPGVTVSCVGNQAPKICWLFTGQGSQYIGMGQQLYNTQPVFREALNRCADILQTYLDKPLLETIFQSRRDVACYVSTENNNQPSIINQTIYTQPAIFAIEYALAQLWLSWGIKPDYVMGHSIGEYVAACIAGVFSLEDGLKLVANRGRLMQELPSSGGMLAIFSSQEKVAEIITAYSEEVNIAAINNGQNTVISGKKTALSKIKEKLDAIAISSRLLKVSHAFHSPLMKPMLADFRQVAESITYSKPRISLVSNVTAQLADREIANPDYWVDHIIQPVKFAPSFQFLLAQGIEIFLEIGAKPILSSLGKTILAADHKPNSTLLIPSLSDKQADAQVILNSLVRLYHQGAKINWQELTKDYYLQEIKLPTYPFQRQKYWWDKAKFWTESNFNNEQQLHPLLGNALALAGISETRFQSQIKADNPKYLQDHCLESQVVFPGAGYLSMAIAAGKHLYKTDNLTLESFTIQQPLLLSDQLITLQTVVSQSDDRFQIFSDTGQDNNFILHSEVVVKESQKIEFHALDVEAIKSKLQPVSDITAYYDKLAQQGLNYGVNFQGIQQLWQGENHALGYIQIPDKITNHNYQLHPALLDSCFQLIGAATESQQGVYLPVSIESLELYRSASNAVWAEITIKPNDNSQRLNADIRLVDSQGSAIALIQNLSLQYLSLSSLRKLINIPSQAGTATIEDWLYEVNWQPQNLDCKLTNELPNNWLIFSQDGDMAWELEKQLPGDSILVFPGAAFKAIAANQYQINPTQIEEFQRLWQEIKSSDSQSWGIIYLDLGANGRSPLQHGCAAILHLMQSSATEQLSQLVIVTQDTQFKNTKNLSGAIWGLARTINLEYPKLNCICLDLEANDIEQNASLILEELQHGNLETQIAYHNHQRHIPRLVRQNNSLSRPFRLQLSEYGTLDNLALAPLKRSAPQAGEIEIAVQASGVNFRDVLNALGVLKEYLQKMGFADATEVPFGGECAGIVVAVGSGVTEFQVGDQVIAAQAVGSLSSHVTVNAKFAIAKPDYLTYAEAATIPTTFLTAYYGLHYLAKIKPGDKILIHAAAGGVGQAAVQLAQKAGAEVLATASVGKWDFLKASGVKYVMNSRTLDFADEVRQLTEGQGVDLILNSLNGDFIPKNLEILAPQGRFVEIGKVGIWDKAQVAEAREDVSYFPFDLLEVSQKNPDLIANLFAELKEKFINKELQPLPHKVFPIQEADQAFRYMAQAKHIGKVVLETTNSIKRGWGEIRNDGCYLITGGLGSLGLQVATWLVAEGAKHLILIGRNQLSDTARKTIAELEELEVTIKLEFADICDSLQLEQIINQVQLPLRGVIHAAGILDDGLLKSLSWERFQAVLEPKITGAWNLHLATVRLDLDWFVSFSSVVSVFGAVGQGNYAAANAFMDNLMSYRRNLGLPGLTINWSIWDDVGMASRLTPQQQQRLSQQGLTAIAPEQGLKVLKRLLQQPVTQSIVFPVDWSAFLAQQPDNPFFERFKTPTTTQEPQATTFLQQLETTPESDRQQILQEHIREQIAKVLGFPDPEEIDTQENFADLGMDSLMAVEFKNNLQASFGDAISLTATFDYPNIELLTEYIEGELFEGRGQKAALKDTAPHKGRGQKSDVKSKKVEVGAQGLRPLMSQESRVKSQESGAPKDIATYFKGRKKIDIKPEFNQFKLTPEFINLKKDLERVEKLGNPFFGLHEGIAKDTIRTGDRELINYSSYNYLGMSGDHIVTEAAQRAIAEYGTSVSASRLLSGERPLHLELEREIADFIGTEDAIAYVGGHATNVSTIGHLFGERDLIICDSLSHNSIKEGCKLSGATIIDFPHNDCQALAEILERERTKYEKVLIAIEGIYSTDGDLAPLPQIVELKQYYQTFLLVDEAHSIGVLGVSGGGVREYFNLQSTDVDLWMGTLSKSFASCGGYIAGDRELIQYLKYTAPGFVFSVGMSPANTVAALAAIQLLKAEPERAIKLQSRAKFCLDLAKSKKFNTGYSANSPIIPVIVGEPNKAVRLSQLLAQEGINVNPMVYPSVPYDAARLRFFVTCLHTEEQIISTMNILAEVKASL
ncbi:polyketide synthase family protein [Xenococcus sp. PCC 7305]|uniref:type I polyketide synthase n=1 Tax=Xenococcus sp. PCC 7305 TaxID=102125 RepID=UPI0002ACCFE1|nr:type I polyketide synthase [Xenococcus sp. PCC 7305]ELS04099.1 polyketide synthase family protein [Xenococcus sp. PCC 7305]